MGVTDSCDTIKCKMSLDRESCSLEGYIDTSSVRPAHPPTIRIAPQTTEGSRVSFF